MTKAHHLKANNIETKSEVSSPTLTQIHRLTASDIEVKSEASSPTLTLNKIIQYIDESQEQIKEEQRESLIEFFKENLENLTGLEVTSAQEYIVEHIPEHIYGLISFAINVLIKASS